MVEVSCEADISCAAEQIFDLIVDLRGQDRWLPPSSSFRGTTEISPGPVGLGTTYREVEPFGVRNGEVTELERPTKITFHQPMTMKLRSGVIDVVMRYALTPQGELTHVRRAGTITIPWALKPFRPVLLRAFRVESRRTLDALKAYADNLPSDPSAYL